MLFLGPNGSGKTTLMRMLTAQIRPTSGQAYVYGLDTLSDSQVMRKIIGYVPWETGVWLDIMRIRPFGLRTSKIEISAVLPARSLFYYSGSTRRATSQH